MAEELVEEVEETEGNQTGTLKIEISFNEEELKSLVRSIDNAPMGGYQNVAKNKQVYTLPTKLLANAIVAKVNEALSDICEGINTHSGDITELNEKVATETERINGLVDEVKTEGASSAEAAADAFLENERQARHAEIQAVIDRIGSAAQTDEEGNLQLGIASLNESGQIPSTQLPSYVDDVIEGFFGSDSDRNKIFFAYDATHLSTTNITPVTGKIYIDLNTGLSYRWSGSAFVLISSPIELGDGAGQAFPGLRGSQAEKEISALKEAVETIQNDYLDSTDIATDEDISQRLDQGFEGNDKLLSIGVFDNAVVASLTSNKNTLTDDTYSASTGTYTYGQRSTIQKWLGLYGSRIIKSNSNWLYDTTTGAPYTYHSVDVTTLNEKPNVNDLVLYNDGVLLKINQVAGSWYGTFIAKLSDTTGISRFYSSTEPYIDINVNGVDEVAKRFFRQSFMIGTTHYGDNFIQDKNGNRFLFPSISQNETLALAGDVDKIEHNFGYYDSQDIAETITGGNKKREIKCGAIYIVFSSNYDLALYKSNSSTPLVSGASQMFLMTAPYSGNKTGTTFVAMGMYIYQSQFSWSNLKFPVEGIQVEIDDGAYITGEQFAVMEMVKGA